MSLYGRLIERMELLDDAADARGVLSHLAGVEHGSHGELVDGKFDLTDVDRARLAAGEPLILRLAVPSDSPHPGGLCIFGASTGQLPLDPTLQIHTRDPLPDDLNVDAHVCRGTRRQPLKKTADGGPRIEGCAIAARTLNRAPVIVAQGNGHKVNAWALERALRSTSGWVAVEKPGTVAGQQPVRVNARQRDETKNRMSGDRAASFVVV